MASCCCKMETRCSKESTGCCPASATDLLPEPQAFPTGSQTTNPTLLPSKPALSHWHQKTNKQTGKHKARGWEQMGTAEEWGRFTGQTQAYVPNKLPEQLPQVESSY